MNFFFVLIVLLPIFLIITISFFVVNWVKTRHMLTPTSLVTFSLIIIMSFILTWYYYPVKGVLNNALPETVTIRTGNIQLVLEDKENIASLLKTIDQNTYSRNASDSLIEIRFPSDHLIRIDLDYVEVGQSTKVVHLYVLNYLGSEASGNLNELAKGNRLQIDNQFYRIKEPQIVSEEIYKLIMQFDEFKDINN